MFPVIKDVSLAVMFY